MPFDGTHFDHDTQILIHARSLLERGWCMGALARDARGYPLSQPTDPTAASWCVIGALRAAGMPASADKRILRRLREKQIYDISPMVGIENFNDRQISVEPILAMFDKAIAQP